MYKISGKVIKGAGYGQVLGFPTVNLDRRGYSRLRKKPKLGVWAGLAIINSKQLLKSKILNPKSYKAGIVIGPYDRHCLPKIEAHLIGFKGNLYDQKIVLILKIFLRPFKKFKSIAELKKRIRKDIKTIKNSKQWIVDSG